MSKENSQKNASDFRLFNPKRDDFLENVALVLKLSAKKMDTDHKLLIRTCRFLAKEFETLQEKNYRILKKPKTPKKVKAVKK